MRIAPSVLGAALVTAALTISSSASAQVGHGRNFGLGLALGYPNVGLSGNAFLSENNSIQFAVAFRFHNYSRYGNGLFVRGDYLFYPATLTRGSAAELKFYVGPGVNLGLGVGNGRGFFLGVEAPLGLAIQLRRAPVDFGLELVPVLEILNGDGGALGFGIGGTLHIRYYF